MEVKSYSKYVRISPKKAREVARILPGKKALKQFLYSNIFQEKQHGFWIKH
jgi:ribosomal protein L22